MKGKMKGNRFKAILLIAVFILSTITIAIPMILAAIPEPTLALNNGTVGEIVTLNGTASIGGLIEIYWDTTAPVNLLSTTYADGAGKYTSNVTIPPDVEGLHYIIAKDFSTGDTNSSEFTITPEITLDPAAGLPTDDITVSGTGFAGTSEIDIYFGNSTTVHNVTDTPSFISVVGNNTDNLLEFNGTLPENYIIPLSVNITLLLNATETMYVIDDGNGTLKNATTVVFGSDYVNASGTIDYNTGLFDFNVTLDGTGVLNVTSNVNATYLQSLTTDYPADTATTGALGSFVDALFTIPLVDYANYTVRTIDASQNYYDTNFTVTATITLSPIEGPTGTTVTIVGNGFTSGDANITFAYLDDEEVHLGNIVILESGIFEASFIVPTVPVESYTVRVNTTGTNATAEFEVTGTTWITLTPTTGKPGSTVTIEGGNFTATLDTEVTVQFEEISAGIFYTNATGGFTGTFDVPTLPTQEWNVTAIDTNNLNANETFTIAITMIVFNPSIGPTGTNVTITGYGFQGYANITFGDILVLKNEPKDNIGNGTTFIVPTVPVGDYTVTVEDDQDLTASETFTVNATTEITMTPSSAPLNYNFTIEGKYFSGESTIDIDLYNDTHIVHLAESLTTATNGSFTISVNVTGIDLGNYFVNATDTHSFPGALELITVQDVPFSLVTADRDIHTLSTEYDPEDTVRFYVKSTFQFNLTLNIKDPTNYPYTTITIDESEWEPMGNWYVVPYNKASFTLPSDAETGTWNWTAIDTSVPEEVTNGTFTVGEVVEPQPDLPAETTGQETLDSSGAPATNFAMGDSILASASVENIGTEDQYMLIVYKLTDPDYHTLINYGEITLPPGIPFAPSLNFNIPDTGYSTGTWTLTVMIIDNWPALGGEMLGEPVTATFTVD